MVVARRSRRAVGLLRALPWTLVVLLAATVVWAPHVPVPGPADRLDGLVPFTQAVAFRWPLAAVVTVVGLLVAGLALVRRRLGIVAIALAGTLLLGAPAVGAGLPVRRDDAPLPPDRRAARLTVLTANMLASDGAPGAVAVEARRRRADVLALDETSRALAVDVLRGLPGGEEAWARTTVAGRPGVPRREGSTTLLIRRTLRPRRVTVAGPPTRNGEALARVRLGGRPLVLLATHPPTTERASQRRRELRRLRGLCRSGVRGDPVLVAGDLDVVPAHYAFAALRDAGCANATAGLAGTWPARWPALVRAPTTHVLTSAPRIRSVAAGSAAVPGSDRRLVWTTLELAR